VNRVARGALVAGALSGAPSTVHALLTGGSVLDAPRAAGVLLGKRSLARGLVAHAAISTGWAIVLVPLLPARHRVAWGAGAGAAIHVLDMEIIGRFLSHLRDLPRLPQLADHVAYGALVAWASAESS
jgi:hypothetical protein